MRPSPTWKKCSAEGYVIPSFLTQRHVFHPFRDKSWHKNQPLETPKSSPSISIGQGKKLANSSRSSAKGNKTTSGPTISDEFLSFSFDSDSETLLYNQKDWYYKLSIRMWILDRYSFLFFKNIRVTEKTKNWKPKMPQLLKTKNAATSREFIIDGSFRSKISTCIKRCFFRVPPLSRPVSKPSPRHLPSQAHPWRKGKFACRRRMTAKQPNPV